MTTLTLFRTQVGNKPPEMVPWPEFDRVKASQLSWFHRLFEVSSMLVMQWILIRSGLSLPSSVPVDINDTSVRLLLIQIHISSRACTQISTGQVLRGSIYQVVRYSMAAWAIVEGQFEILRDFCGGIATVFPNTASVESDFSILGWEKDRYRLSITDLSLEGIMHCQYEMLSLLA